MAGKAALPATAHPRLRSFNTAAPPHTAQAAYSGGKTAFAAATASLGKLGSFSTKVDFEGC